MSSNDLQIDFDSDKKCFNLNAEQIEFVINHINDDLSMLALSKSKFKIENIDLLINEINCRRKLRFKFFEWADNFSLKMPLPVNIEQSSSKLTAYFKSKIVSYDSSLDLTSGFGIDSYFISLNSKSHIIVEQNFSLSEIVKYNFGQLNIANTTVICNTAEEFLKTNTNFYDLIYIDPSRRNNHGGRKFLLADYKPNIIELISLIKSKCKFLLLKLSPMLDITLLHREFTDVKHIFVVSVESDCKELLVLFDFDTKAKFTGITATELAEQSFEITFDENISLPIEYSLPCRYLYDVHTSIKKAGKNDYYAAQLNLLKISPNTHLYTSDELVDNFHGKIYELIDVTKINHIELAKTLPQMKAVVVRYGFPLSVDEIRKKFKILEGNENIIFAVKLINQRNAFIIAKKINNLHKKTNK